ncbi:MAG: DUF2177 family protein [Parachlamydiales bacterium]|nr:DUF2177 family protein [Parachlamydiales bacterium]
MNYFKLYAIALAAFILIDSVWLGLIAKGFYQEQIGFLMTRQIRWGAAFLFYAVYILGLIVFVISPAIKGQNNQSPLLYGALFGLIAYGTYDLTNLATIEGWPIKLVVVDLLWGTFISAATSWITYWAGTIWKISL